MKKETEKGNIRPQRIRSGSSVSIIKHPLTTFPLAVSTPDGNYISQKPSIFLETISSNYRKSKSMT